MHKIHVIIVLISLSEVFSDFILEQNYQSSTDCTGQVFTTAASSKLGAGDLGFGGCKFYSSFVYAQEECISPTSYQLVFYTTATCEAGTQSTTTPQIIPVPFGCFSTGSTSSFRRSCGIGSFYPSSNAYTRFLYPKSINCFSIDSSKPTAIIENVLDTCLLNSTYGGYQTYRYDDAVSINVNLTSHLSSDCSDEPVSSIIVDSVGCITSSQTIVTKITAPAPSVSPTASVSPSASPPLQLVSYLQTEIYNDIDCSGSPNSISISSIYQGCIMRNSFNSISILRVCSSDGTSYLEYSYLTKDCSGKPSSSSSRRFLPQCEQSEVDNTQYVRKSCRNGQYVAPANSFVTEKFQYSPVCNYNYDTDSVSFLIYLLNKCISLGETSVIYSCSSTDVITTLYDSPDCSENPSYPSMQTLGTCMPGTYYESSSILYCSGQTGPVPSTAPSSLPPPSHTPSASLSKGSSPSTTPTFRATITPINSRLTSNYGLIGQANNCGFTARSLEAGYYSLACFAVDAKSLPIMSILVYNPRQAVISIKQLGLAPGVTTVDNAYDISLMSGLNSISSTSLWVRLGNISCTTSDNPSGICAIKFEGDKSFTFWLSIYRIDEVIANDGLFTITVAVGGVIGGVFFLFLLLGTMHIFRIINVPCFSWRNANKKKLTMTPESGTVKSSDKDSLEKPVQVHLQQQQIDDRAKVWG
jgi:hypothetical protein